MEKKINMDIKRKIQLLSDMKKLFDKNNIEFFPIHGTLLGIVRDGEIIPWDEDIDIGTWHTDYDKILNLRKDFEDLGYELSHKNKYCHVNITPYEEVHAKKDSKSVPFHIGIDFLAKDKDKVVLLKFFDTNMFDKLLGISEKNKIQNFFRKIYYSLILYMRDHEVYPYAWFEKTKTIKAYNLRFNIPVGYKQYLELTYGPTWKTPDKNYSKEKWVKNNENLKKYKLRDKSIRNLWIKRWEN